jgi:hypothetical protein
LETRQCKTCSASKSLDDFRAKIVAGKRYWSHQCKECDKPAACARKQRWYAADPDRARADSRDWYAANTERAQAAVAEYRVTRKDWWKEYHRQWRARNPVKVLAWVGRYQAAKLRAMPAWADQQKIATIYEQAAQRGLEVDHAVPLRSKLVCGLHVEHNLQPLPPTANNSKGNRWWPDMWEGE